ncbi:rhodanese-like domain-containing protein [Gaetbulibacter sp. M235]|uniref:rhodanese-like domain-containing protein n=1 Tax=Gaetbulibacter sp. M235 TaxID=3126510 RepID=UPI00374F576B
MKTLLNIFFALVVLAANAQESLPELLKQYNTKNIPYITVQELAMPKTQAIILDAREYQEYKTSHLKNALPVGYGFFELDSVIKNVPNKDGKIVVYCSIGIRSETIAYKLKKAGYKNVFNLYGGIFEWKNNNFPVYNSDEQETENIHIFSEEWSKWLKKGRKVF